MLHNLLLLLNKFDTLRVALGFILIKIFLELIVFRYKWFKTFL